MNPAPQEVDPPFEQAPIQVDARGLRCPLPVIRLAEVARNAPSGTCIVVLASDPAARHDIPAWCRMRHHELVEQSEVSDPGDDTGAQTDGGPAGGASAAGAPPAYLRFVVRILPQPANAGGGGSGSERSSRAM